MSESLVSYRLADGVATITMDDGKVNALSPAMFAALNEAMDKAEADGAVVLLQGRPGVFSAGFDLNVLRLGGPDARGMLRSGFELAGRLLGFPAPVVAACPGHAMAMGVFLLLSADLRIGAAGPFRISANEVAIGLTVPRSALVVCRQRLTPAALARATLLADVFSPDEAVAAGFLDRVVAPDELVEAAGAVARAIAAGLDRQAHAATKQRLRAAVLADLAAAIAEDDAAEWVN